jgi:hypothetical protein
MMSIFKKDWTPLQADEWTYHDYLASLFSALSYLLVAVGVAGALLLQWWGFVTLGIGIVCIILMFKVIDPKLKAISQDFEAKEREYLEHIDRIVRWESEESGGDTHGNKS